MGNCDSCFLSRSSLEGILGSGIKGESVPLEMSGVCKTQGKRDSVYIALCSSGSTSFLWILANNSEATACVLELDS